MAKHEGLPRRRTGGYVPPREPSEAKPHYRRDTEQPAATRRVSQEQAAPARVEQEPVHQIPKPRERQQRKRTAEISENGHPFVDLPRKWAEGESSGYSN